MSTFFPLSVKTDSYGRTSSPYCWTTSWGLYAVIPKAICVPWTVGCLQIVRRDLLALRQKGHQQGGLPLTMLYGRLKGSARASTLALWPSDVGRLRWSMRLLHYYPSKCQGGSCI